MTRLGGHKNKSPEVGLLLLAGQLGAGLFFSSRGSSGSSFSCFRGGSGFGGLGSFGSPVVLGAAFDHGPATLEWCHLFGCGHGGASGIDLLFGGLRGTGQGVEAGAGIAHRRDVAFVDLDLRQAQTSPEGAVIDAFAMWGGIEIKVPEGWRVVSEVVPLLGGYEDNTRPPADPEAVKGRLVVRGVVIMVTLGTGIGSALFQDGELVPNTELGHLPLGKSKDAEKVAAESVREAENLSWKEWANRLDHYFDVLERLFSPDLIIVGGGVSKKSDKFLPHISSGVEIVPARLLNEAGIVGAAIGATKSGTAS